MNGFFHETNHTMALRRKLPLLLCLLLCHSFSIVSSTWDVEEEFWRLEFPAAGSPSSGKSSSSSSPINFADEENRRLHVMTSRGNEVTRHRDIVTRANGGSPRVFDDSGSCGVDDDQTPCCNQTCSDLSYCSALNGRRIEDKYFPTLPFIQVCVLHLHLLFSFFSLFFFCEVVDFYLILSLSHFYNIKI
jgi:hypothetical protein